MKTSRRNFLKTLSTGTSITALSMLAPIHKIFERDLKSVFHNSAIPSAKDYTLADEVTYLNHGSIGTIPKIVQKAHQDYLSLCETNPWFYMWSGEWDEPVEKVRRKVANYINAESSEISLPHNTTEVYNILAQGLRLGKGDEVLYSNLNHAGAGIPFQIHSKKYGYSVKVFDIPTDDLSSVTKQDILDLYESNITSKTRLLVIPHIDNTFGLRQPVKEITALARAKGVDFISIDTAQTMGMLPVDVKDLDIDVIGTSAHKWLQAPKGISVAYFSEKIQKRLDPMWVTWGQKEWSNTARKYEDYGTRNLPEVLTLGHSVDFQSNINEASKTAHLKKLWEHAKLLTEKNPSTTWRSPSEWDLSGSLFVIGVKGEKPSDLAQRMYNDYGFVFRPFDQYSTIRISPNLFNSTKEIDQLFKLIV